MAEQIKLNIKLADAELEIQGSKEDLESLLPLVEKYLNSIKQVAQKKQPDTEIPAQEQIESAADNAGEIPNIVTRSLREAIRQLLNSDWGRIPRTSREIKDALALNALHYELPPVTANLTQMLQKGELRRLKKGSVYAYVPSRKG